MDFLRNWLTDRGLTDAIISVVVPIVLFVIALLVAWFVHVVIRRIVLRILKRVIRHTQTSWDDILLSENVFDRALRLVPAIILHVARPSSSATTRGSRVPSKASCSSSWSCSSYSCCSHF